MDSILKAHGVSKRYGDSSILENCAIEGRLGQSIALIGPSGCGKSTLLSMLGLLLTPTEGNISIDGMNTANLKDSELARIRHGKIGFVFQHAQLIGSLRAWENVAVPARFSLKGERKWPRKQLEERSRELLGEFGLSDRCDHYPFQLSIGQKRRIALARALLLDPPIIIADEPTNDLDSANSASVSAILFEKAKEGHLLILATHDEKLYERADVAFRIENKHLERAE